MCGIAGYYSKNNLGDQLHEPILQMLNLIEHRGPDHQGIFRDKNIAMGNQRLKVIDLSGGNQPKTSHCGRYVVVYNGEIYNYRELKRDLEDAGVSFVSDSDTEVLVNGYSHYGVDFFNKLDGMFAASLYDQKSGEVILLRDRMGIKPLFYAQVNDVVVFSSEIKSLLEFPNISKELNYSALQMYLKQGFIPQPWTAFKGIKRLKAGHYLKLNRESVSEVEYFDLDFSKKIQISREEASQRLLELAELSVKEQVHADVPVGVFLSGGFDSSLVLAMLHKNGFTPKSFTLSFDDPIYDENIVSEKWAKALNFPHKSCKMNETEFIQFYKQRSSHYGEPLFPWINSGRSFLAEKVKEEGVTVVLNGAGGDELFCGYPTLNALVVSRQYRKVPSFLRESAVKGLVNALPAGQGVLPLSYKIKSFVNSQDKDLLKTFFNFKNPLFGVDLSEIFSPDFVEMIEKSDGFDMFEQYRHKIEDWDLIDQAQYLDIKCFLEGSILCLGDNATMAQSIEERVPLLSNRIVEFAQTLPLETKFQLNQLKPVIKQALAQYMGSLGHDDLVKLCAKKGFDLPGNKWLKSGRWGEFLSDEVLQPERLNQMGIYNQSGIHKLIDEHKMGRKNNERSLQSIAGFVEFFAQYGGLS